MSGSRLFKPLKLGNLELKHRVAMAPLTRFRADDSHVHTSMAVEYYGQRASVPGTFMLTEATFIGQQYGGFPNVPGIWNQDQIDSWTKVVDAVHKKGSYIFLQMWAIGRTAHPGFSESEGIIIKSSSPAQLSPEHAVPKEMTHEDIKDAIAHYVQAAKNAIAAGFDGVEIHGANGYLIDQFTQDVVNSRTDEYGGSIENRSRFALEVAKAVTDAVGAKRTGIRLSPFSDWQGMYMKDPVPQFSYLVQQLNKLGLAYIHLTTPRVAGIEDRSSANNEVESFERIIAHYDGTLLLAGGFKPETAVREVDEVRKDRDVVIVFGRYFIQNPDLVYRLQKGIEFTPYDRSTFYVNKDPKGYVDVPFSKEFTAEQANL